MFGLGLIHFLIIIAVSVVISVVIVGVASKKEEMAWREGLICFVILFICLTLIVGLVVALDMTNEAASKEREHTTQTAQQAISHFIEDVHSGQLESDLWTLAGFSGLGTNIYRVSPTETIWMEIIVWLTIREYDITHNQIRRELERGRISIEPYVNISGLREVLNE